MGGICNFKKNIFLGLLLLFTVTMLYGCSTAEEVIDEVEVTDTVRWFNASYALLTEINKWDYNLFGGAKNTEENQNQAKQMLSRWWDVTDKAAADKTLEWVLTEGHHENFVSIMHIMEEDGMDEVEPEERQGFLKEHYDLDEAYSELYVQWYEMYEEYGEGAIDGWDYCRAMNFTGYCYLAGFYSKEEALDKSLEIAEMIQTNFESWDDLMDSYMRGYEFWAEESSEKRRAVYEKLKKKKNGPYEVDFSMSLEKTW